MPVEILGLHHYTLRTRDLKRATAFYEGVFGLKRKPQPGMATRTARYDLGDWELQLLETDDLPDREDAPDPRESHPAIEVDNIHNAVAACLSGGAEMQQVTFVRDEDGSQSAFLRDPDGNLLELCSHPGRFARRAAPTAPSPAVAANGAPRPVVMASAPSLPDDMEDYKPPDFFSGRNQKRENWQLIVTLLAAAALLGIGVLLRYTLFPSEDSVKTVATPLPSVSPATGDKEGIENRGQGTGIKPATPSATATPSPTPPADPVTPSLSETGGMPAPPEPKRQ